MKSPDINRYISSKHWFVQVLGAMLLNYGMSLWMFLTSISILLFLNHWWYLTLAAITLFLWSIWHVVRVLNPIFSLRKEELSITWSQIILLIVIGLWICGVGVILTNYFESEGILSNVGTKNITILIGVLGGILGWIFQDTVKSVVAFFHLRLNGLLQIGDWIELPSKGVDGVVKNVNLATVTIENWDTTTSSIPTYLLNSDHFRNNQMMMTGKTYGRMAQKTFIIDTGWIHTITEPELEKLKTILNSMDDVEKDFYEYYINNGEAKAGKLNAQLYRQYIYHWLMHNVNVSHMPRLIVRWLEQTPEGMPLQIYVFLTSTSLDSFEWQQSLIIERIIESLAWFNLQLYQSPSGFDASNSNIYLSPETAHYIKNNQSNDR